MNLIFDLGGVVFTWEPDSLIQKIFPDSYAAQRVRDDIFHHSDWADLDRGTLTRDDAIERAIRRTGLPAKEITTLLQEIPFLLKPIPQTVSLLKRLRQKTNHRLFVLSNMHLASIHHLERQYSLWDLFDGVVISCYIHLVKPELTIYQHILERYELDPSMTIFMDDTQANLDAASKVGIRTLLFENPKQCEQKLRESQGVSIE